MIKISDKVILLSENDFIENFKILLNNDKPKELYFGMIVDIERVRLNPELLIFKAVTQDKMYLSKYEFMGHSYNTLYANLDIKKFDDYIISYILNNYYGNKVRFILREESYEN